MFFMNYQAAGVFPTDLKGESMERKQKIGEKFESKAKYAKLKL